MGQFKLLLLLSCLAVLTQAEDEPQTLDLKDEDLANLDPSLTRKFIFFPWKTTAKPVVRPPPPDKPVYVERPPQYYPHHPYYPQDPGHYYPPPHHWPTRPPTTTPTTTSTTTTTPKPTEPTRPHHPPHYHPHHPPHYPPYYSPYYPYYGYPSYYPPFYPPYGPPPPPRRPPTTPADSNRLRIAIPQDIEAGYTSEDVEEHDAILNDLNKLTASLAHKTKDNKLPLDLIEKEQRPRKKVHDQVSLIYLRNYKNGRKLKK